VAYILNFFSRLGYVALIRQVVFLFTPDAIHNYMVLVMRRVQQYTLYRRMSRVLYGVRQYPVLQQTFHGQLIISPIGVAAGFDKSLELRPLISTLGVGFMTAGSLTYAAIDFAKGEKMYHRLRYTRSVAVRAQLRAESVEVALNNLKKSTGEDVEVPAIISLAVSGVTVDWRLREAVDATKASLELIAKTTDVLAVELHIGCVNKQGEQPFCAPEGLEELLGGLKNIAINVPLYIKLPSVEEPGDIAPILTVLMRHNDRVSGVTVANLRPLESVMVDPRDDRPPRVDAWRISGAPTRATSTEIIRYVYKKTNGSLTIIGVGGVASAQDAYEKIRAGASLVGMFTGIIFGGPALPAHVNRGLALRLKKDGFQSISEAVGADHRTS